MGADVNAANNRGWTAFPTALPTEVPTVGPTADSTAVPIPDLETILNENLRFSRDNNVPANVGEFGLCWNLVPETDAVAWHA